MARNVSVETREDLLETIRERYRESLKGKKLRGARRLPLYDEANPQHTRVPFVLEAPV
jgi:hypothetical protein